MKPKHDEKPKYEVEETTAVVKFGLYYWVSKSNHNKENEIKNKNRERGSPPSGSRQRGEPLFE